MGASFRQGSAPSRRLRRYQRRVWAGRQNRGSGHRLADGKIHILEVATGKEVRRFQGHGAYVSTLAFAPNSKTLASGQRDTTVLVWDIAHSSRNLALANSNPSDRDLERLWSDMAGSDAAAAHRAIWTMVAAPEQAVNFIKHKLPAIPRATPERLRQLVADPDSSNFPLREAASKELTRNSGLKHVGCCGRHLSEVCPPRPAVEQSLNPCFSGSDQNRFLG